MRLFLSYSPTNWIFCAMAQNLAMTAKGKNLGRKESRPLCLGNQRLLWFCSVQRDAKSRRDENEQDKTPAAPHTTQHLPFSLLSLAPAAAKPAEQE